jgi:type II secretion system protein N
MAPIVNAIRDILRFHKLKILITAVFTLIFLVLLFPYGDLGNLLTTTIYDGSGQQLYVHADDLQLSLLPFPGVQANKVAIEPGARGARFNPLSFDELEIRPLLSALLALRAGASVDAKGVFGGSLDVSARTANAVWSADPGALTISGLSVEDVSLASLLSYVLPGSGLKMSGKLFAESDELKYDPNGKDGLTGDLALALQGVSLPTEIPVPGFGSLNIPPIKIAKANFATNMGKNKLAITTGNFGVDQDPLSGRILGEVDVRQTPQGMLPGAFNLCIELNVNQDFYNKLPKEYSSLFEGFKSVTENYRRKDQPGMKYGIRASGFDIRNMATWETRPGDCKQMTAPAS